MSKHLVAYLTGPPASGKTSLARGLGEKGIAVFSYSQQLGLHIAAKRASSLTHEQLRERSASVVTREDVDEVDQQLVDFIRSERSTRPVIIDSHAVTREPYGFRVLPFATEHLRNLELDKIIALYASSDVLLQRIARDPGGRQTASIAEVERQTHLQSAVAVSYSAILGCPLYLLDSGHPAEELEASVKALLS